MAKQLVTKMPVQGMMLSIPTGGKVLNLSHSSLGLRESNQTLSPDIRTFFDSTWKFYIGQPWSSDRVRTCLDLKALRDSLSENLDGRGAKLYDSCSYFPPGAAGDTLIASYPINSIRRGLMISCDSTLDSDVAEEIIREAVVKNGLPVYHYVKYTVEDNVDWSLISIKGGNSTVLENGVVYTAPRPLYHPIYSKPGQSPLFHSYKEAKAVMLQVGTEKAMSFLKTIENLVEENSALEDVTSVDRPYPLIVIEGLDGTGKSTLAKSLSKSINGVDIHTPSDDLQLWRPHFESYPELIRRSYFTLCSYASANQIAKLLQNTPVVIDRYWHTTAAYTMAREVSQWGVSALPPKGHWVYRWPSDLLCPSMVLYLYVSEGVRCQRLQSRDEGLTPEEMKLSQLPALRDSLDQAYRRMENPHVTVIDASGSREDVFQKALEAVKPLIKK